MEVANDPNEGGWRGGCKNMSGQHLQTLYLWLPSKYDSQQRMGLNRVSPSLNIQDKKSLSPNVGTDMTVTTAHALWSREFHAKVLKIKLQSCRCTLRLREDVNNASGCPTFRTNKQESGFNYRLPWPWLSLFPFLSCWVNISTLFILSANQVPRGSFFFSCV